jgi:FAD/FMN-containing dehydrogenase
MDGNMHTMLLLAADQGHDASSSKELLTAIYTAAVEMGGVISGEHGIGCLQQEFLPLQLSTKHISILQQIKKIFDPNGILNPGKLLSEGLNN